MRDRRRRAAGLLVAALLTACATPPSDPAARAAFDQTNDPLEPLNRKVFDLNQFIDRIVLKPATKIYVVVVPEAGRDAIKNALDNMKEPVVAINNVLQGRPKGAGIAVGRLIVNTTIGLAGVIDVAKKWGLAPQTGDFGQTLYAWDFPQGPYLILPILGPSNPRDAIGMAADNYIDPFSYAATAADIDDMNIVRFVLGGIDERARATDTLDDLQKNSLDFYAELRSLVEQHRAAVLRHGAAPAPSPGFYDVPATAAGINPPAAPPASSPP
ncbi:MAG TPA: VacJ family lipoprotein [Stellaceae bacterium]|nr:VacJ family lipoprotein [Stellaceae bacterium]